MRYTSPSFEDTELTAAPYRGKGLGTDVVKVRWRCDHGYKDALGLLVDEGPFVGLRYI